MSVMTQWNVIAKVSPLSEDAADRALSDLALFSPSVGFGAEASSVTLTVVADSAPDALGVALTALRAAHVYSDSQTVMTTEAYDGAIGS